MMKSIFETIGKLLVAAAFGLAFAALLVWGIRKDNDDLLNGKSPHSGFCPECPVYNLNPLCHE